MLFGVVVTTNLFLDIVHKWLSISCAKRILTPYYILAKVTISMTFELVVVFG